METLLEVLRHNEIQARKAGWFETANACREHADSLEANGFFDGQVGPYWYRYSETDRSGTRHPIK